MRRSDSQRQTATNARDVSPVRVYWAERGVTMPPYDDEEEYVPPMWSQFLRYLRRGPELVSTSRHAEPQDMAAEPQDMAAEPHEKTLAQRRGWKLRGVKTEDLDKRWSTDQCERAHHRQYPSDECVCVGRRGDVCRCAANSRFHPKTGNTEYLCTCGYGTPGEYVGEWRDLHPFRMDHDLYATLYQCAPKDRDKQEQLTQYFQNGTMLQSGVQGVFGGNPYKC